MRFAILPARGGSVRVPSKNRRVFHGKPMLEYPIRAAQASGLFDLIVVSTDDPVIAHVAYMCGALVLPRGMDDGTVGTQEIAARVLDELNVWSDLACVIYPCTPLLESEHLQVGLNRLLMPDAKSFAYSVGPDGQDAGAFYWGWVTAFRNRIPLVGNAAHVVLPGECVCDINTPEDWERAEQMFERRQALIQQAISN